MFYGFSIKITIIRKYSKDSIRKQKSNIFISILTKSWQKSQYVSV